MENIMIVTSIWKVAEDIFEEIASAIAKYLWRDKKMRLIDADKIIDSLGISDMDFAIGAVIDEQPTAFDVDKVVGELKRDKFIESECILSDVHQGYNAGLSRAVEIVKGGGVDG
jgi:hypothetical protein